MTGSKELAQKEDVRQAMQLQQLLWAVSESTLRSEIQVLRAEVKLLCMRLDQSSAEMIRVKKEWKRLTEEINRLQKAVDGWKEKTTRLRNVRERAMQASPVTVPVEQPEKLDEAERPKQPEEGPEKREQNLKEAGEGNVAEALSREKKASGKPREEDRKRATEHPKTEAAAENQAAEGSQGPSLSDELATLLNYTADGVELNREQLKRRRRLFKKAKLSIQTKLGIPQGSEEPNEEVDKRLLAWLRYKDARWTRWQRKLPVLVARRKAKRAVAKQEELAEDETSSTTTASAM